jgi:hypothetical protein
MCILDVSIEVVFAGECLITILFGTRERALSGVHSHMRLETAWAVEALPAALELANELPVSSRLAQRSSLAIGFVFGKVVVV